MRLQRFSIYRKIRFGLKMCLFSFLCLSLGKRCREKYNRLNHKMLHG